MTSQEYLQTLRSHLKSLPATTREEVVLEIASHIQDSIASGVPLDVVLARLGPPERVAAAYRDNLLLGRARRGFSPLLIARAAIRLATKGLFGFLVFLCATIGYCLGGAFVVVALVKPLFPHHTGLWIGGPEVFALGVRLFPPGPPAHEILGHTIIPLCLTIGAAVILLTAGIVRVFLRTSRFVQNQFQSAPESISRPATAH